MGYRSLKRVLGETSLERKCRLLFGTCLFLLISGAFVWVDKIAEEQVSKTDRQKHTNAEQKARSFADTGLLKLHFIFWASLRDDETAAPFIGKDEPLIRQMLEDLDSHDYQHAVLGNEEKDGVILFADHELPHVARLLELRKQRDDLRAQQANQAEAAAPNDNTQPTTEGDSATSPASQAENPSNGVPPTKPGPKADQPKSDVQPGAGGAKGNGNGVNRNAAGTAAKGDSDAKDDDNAGATGFFATLLKDRSEESDADPLNDPVAIDTIMHDPEGKQYYAYYQLVEWKNTCVHCHTKTQTAGALSAAEAGLLQEQEPVRVVRVIFPHQWEDQDSVNRIRAILTSASILTFFVAMIALYVIVRYVIVKPLQHLRDVSDEISRGETDLRAEIHTNDEFEDLADSFNRMLRHLTETQENIRGINKALDAKVDELAQVNMRLYEMNRLKSDFLANMSHELRTPLNSIIGFSEVLSGIDSLTDKQKRYANNIQNSGRVLLEMINDILDLAKVEAGKMEIRPSEFHVDAIVSAQCDMVRSLTEEKNIDLLVEVEKDLAPLYQDQIKVQQILTNLLSNAIKFTPEGGRIDVRAEMAANDRLLLTVQDTGVGIPEEDREIIFEKFRQSKTVLGDDGLTREYSGTGLGLSIVKELCKLLGGEIDFESEVGKGSRFFVWLPTEAPPQVPTPPSTNADIEDIALETPDGISRW